MYQLNYRSIARPGLTLEDLDQILETAMSFNQKRNITGCLIYHQQSFVQILEGDKNDILEIYEKIKADERHRNVTLLWDNHTQKRFFEEWSMAFYNPNSKDMQQFVNNMLLLSEFSNKSSGSLYSFWETVRRILNGDTIDEVEPV